MNKKTVIIPFLIIGLTLVIAKWDGISYWKGRLDARLNIKMGKKIAYSYGGLRVWEDDTVWIADSLFNNEMGFDSRGAGCAVGSSFAAYIDGYNSLYAPYLEKQIIPGVRMRAKEILEARPSNWKEGMTESQRRARMLIYGIEN